MHKQRNNKTSSIFDKYFIENKDKHKHNTRQTHNLHIKRPNDSYGKHKIQYREAKLWNAIPQASREVTCNNNFGKKKHGSTIIKISKYWTVSKVAVNIPANLYLFYFYILFLNHRSYSLYVSGLVHQIINSTGVNSLMHQTTKTTIPLTARTTYGT